MLWCHWRKNNLRAFMSNEKAEADPARMAERARDSLAMV